MFCWQNIKRNIRHNIRNAKSVECSAGSIFSSAFGRTIAKHRMSNVLLAKHSSEHSAEHRVLNVVLGEHSLGHSADHSKCTEGRMFCLKDLQQDTGQNMRNAHRTLDRTFEMHRVTNRIVCWQNIQQNNLQNIRNASVSNILKAKHSAEHWVEHLKLTKCRIFC